MNARRWLRSSRWLAASFVVAGLASTAWGGEIAYRSYRMNGSNAKSYWQGHTFRPQVEYYYPPDCPPQYPAYYGNVTRGHYAGGRRRAVYYGNYRLPGYRYTR